MSCPQHLIPSKQPQSSVDNALVTRSQFPALKVSTTTTRIWGELTTAIRIGGTTSVQRNSVMNVYSFLKDVCITNSYVLHKKYSPSRKFKRVRDFRLQLAIELIGDYCSKKRPGCRTSTPAKTLPLAHFPLHHPENKRGRCQVCKSKNKRRDSPVMVLPQWQTSD